jgi:hypothetical protein
MSTFEAVHGVEMLCPDTELQPVVPEPRNRGRLYAAGAMAAGLVLSLAAPAEASTELNYPNGTVAEQNIIFDTEAARIEASPAGSTITFSNPGLGVHTERLLERAHDRGVNIQVVIAGMAPGNDSLHQPAQNLMAELGTDVNQPSFVHVCEHGCNSSRNSSLHHDKTFLFSDVDGHPITQITSLDDIYSNADNVFNNSQSTSSERVYRHMRGWIRSMVDGKPQSFPHPFHDGNTDIYTFPQAASTRSHNFYTKALDAINCRRHGKLLHTKVLLAVSLFSGNEMPVAHRLARLEDESCDVQVEMNRERSSKEVADYLKEHHVPTRWVNKPGIHMHSKILAWHNRKHEAVYSGSLNLGINLMRTADDVMIRVKNSPATFKAYAEQFQAMWKLGRKV